MLEEKLFVNNLLDAYGNLLTTKQQEIMEMFFRQDTSLAEIADELSVTRQAVYDAVNKAVNQLKIYEKKIGLLEKLGIIKTDLIALKPHSTDKAMKDRVQKIIDKI